MCMTDRSHLYHDAFAKLSGGQVSAEHSQRIHSLIILEGTRNVHLLIGSVVSTAHLALRQLCMLELHSEWGRWSSSGWPWMSQGRTLFWACWPGQMVLGLSASDPLPSLSYQFFRHVMCVRTLSMTAEKNNQTRKRHMNMNIFRSGCAWVQTVGAAFSLFYTVEPQFFLGQPGMSSGRNGYVYVPLLFPKRTWWLHDQGDHLARIGLRRHLRLGEGYWGSGAKISLLPRCGWIS